MSWLLCPVSGLLVLLLVVLVLVVLEFLVLWSFGMSLRSSFTWLLRLRSTCKRRPKPFEDISNDHQCHKIYRLEPDHISARRFPQTPADRYAGVNKFLSKSKYFDSDTAVADSKNLETPERGEGNSSKFKWPLTL